LKDLSGGDCRYRTLVYAGRHGFLVWMWISNVAILLGAELDAELQRGRAIAVGHDPTDEPFLALRDDRKIRQDRFEETAVKFVVKKTSNGQFRFNLVAGNGQVVATSESYTRKNSAMETIASIQKSAGTATVDDETTD